MKQPKINNSDLFLRRRPEHWVWSCGLLFCLWFGLSGQGFSRGSAPVYEDPFDVAAGGSSLTRASQAGMIFSNPALIPYGTGFHRWLGNETSLIIGKDSVDFAKSLTSGSGAGDEGSGNSQFINTVLTTPIHAGVLNNFSYINRFFGFSVFNRAEFDVHCDFAPKATKELALVRLLFCLGKCCRLGPQQNLYMQASQILKLRLRINRP
jgi:hypothetical protein